MKYAYIKSIQTSSDNLQIKENLRILATKCFEQKFINLLKSQFL